MSVIGFLIALLIPSLKRSVDLASATVCRHNLREIGHSLSLYRYENDGWLPTVQRKELSIEVHGATQPWFGKLYPTYLGDPLVLRCPRDPFGFRMQQIGSPMDDPQVADYVSYGINDFIMTSGGGMLADVDRHVPKRPLDTILVADIGPDDARGAPRAGTGTSAGPSRNGSLLMWSDGFDPFSNKPDNSWLTTRHGHGINMLTLAEGVREVRTVDMLRSPVRRHYGNCAAGGCTFCNYLKLYHYSFARDHLFWWTGPLPTE